MFGEVHDEEQCGLVRRNHDILVFEKALVLMKISVLSHCVTNRLIKRQAKLQI